MKKSFALLIAMILIGWMAVAPVSAEGSSATVSLALSRTTLNIGKTFTVTLKVTPNTSFPVASFDATLQYDSSKFELVMESGSPKITRPSGVPASFQMDASASGSQITMICADGTTSQNAPINTNGATSLITFTFKVKDAASLGATNFQITECNVTKLESLNPVSVPLTIAPPTAGTVAARLDTNTNLSEIKTDIGVLSPAFSKSVTNYTVGVPAESTSINVTAKTESSLSKAVVSGGKNLAYGSNKVTITVTAQDTDVTKVYTVTVNRASPPASSAEESSIAAEVSEESSEVVSSSEEISDVSSSLPESASSSADPVETSLHFWKLIAYLFIGLFVVTAGTLSWFIYDKLHRQGNGEDTQKPVKIKRIN